jgi:hypothetical protein
MAWLVKIALAVCAVFLVPLALFQATRHLSRQGFFVASYLFGSVTWIFAVVTTYYHLGLFWTLIGIATLFVGVVPLGIIGTAIRSDWMAAGLLIGGIVVTCATRAVAIWLGGKLIVQRLPDRA